MTTNSSGRILIGQGIVTLGVFAVLVATNALSVELLVVLSYLGFLVVVQLSAGTVPVVDFPRWVQIALVVTTLVAFGILFWHVSRVLLG